LNLLGLSETDIRHKLNYWIEHVVEAKGLGGGSEPRPNWTVVKISTGVKENNAFTKKRTESAR